MKCNRELEDPAGLGGEVDEFIWIGDLVRLANFLPLDGQHTVKWLQANTSLYAHRVLSAPPTHIKRTVWGDKS